MSELAPIKRVGFIGIGNMGTPMAANIARAGFELLIYDAQPERCARFAGERACTVARALAELAPAQAIITMLPTGQIVRDVLLHEQGGLARHLARGTLLIDMSSSEPFGTRELGAALAGRGVTLMDAPVSGAVPRARNATLAIMYGCDDPGAPALGLPLLSTMGERLFATGRLGSGHAMKALNNFVAGTTFAALCEALSIGERFGLDTAGMIDILNASTGRSFLTELVMKEHVVAGKHATGFALGLLAKDVKIAAELGRTVRLDAPLTQLVSARWQLARERLGAARDNSEAIHAWQDELPPE
jgi:3-hydroxyisobutyrate dehydrogenase